MLSVQSMSGRLLAVAGAALLADSAPALRVLRTTPSGDAAPTTAVTVTFDRPVAGSLDRTVDPRAIFRIVPATPGTIARTAGGVGPWCPALTASERCRRPGKQHTPPFGWSENARDRTHARWFGLSSLSPSVSPAHW
jgi:hypothetical protein